ncbi:MAG TPA: ABC transporter ATP-binding protein/permease, partial [Gammaproteobacteria bacterium]|nr:ABC transporter ATP-binding protein/permease [Gammaproteobacteria bacterium]
AFDVVFTYWYNYFYNALQAYDKHESIRLLVFFFALAGIYIVIAVYRFYISQLFGLRWRRWLTEQFIDRWLHRRSYYYLENFDEKTDNPDQRIQEDINMLVSSSIALSLGLISAVTTLFAFIYVLWELSGVITIPLGSWGTWHIPGYLVWVGMLYALVGTFFTFKIGRPLVPLNFEQQRREATFRFAAIDLRSHAEHVALYHGEQHQKSILNRLFGRVLDNWYMIIVRQKLLMWYTTGYNQIAVVLPLMVALPHYFDKVFLLGGLMQTLSAFGRVQDSLSFIVNSYTSIAEWQAVNRRLTTFVNHMEDVERQADQENHLKLEQHLDNVIAVRQLDIGTPRGKPLLANINTDLQHGHHYLIKGVSGIGKSTFVRTLAGIWPYATGKITYPQGKKIMFLPQRPYMPLGTLAEALLFPDKNNPKLEQQLKTALDACNLSQFIPRLHETATWSEQLSPGEQQRIAFARVLLHHPDWVFLDESTSMLDAANEKHLYEILKTQLPHCSVVSVGHRVSLDDHHDQIIDMATYKSSCYNT